ncbi:MAG: endonuclease III [Marine Group III euryarchaeote CG-Epi3]|uniref:Endonuclease III n=1 Tax=Marine Group III euryarchaeote CG-Epi3 TaxID=1888997 RepID=A0A1J5TT93_9ARCH|nr:MAG: endonuclease III [Marine Group III euryarchaeote CG-Epi3]
MRLAQKVEYISSKLEKLYPNPDIPLDHENNFTFLIAVMLSAQSTDKKVNEITPNLFSKANSPKNMDKLSVEEIQSLIREIGLAPTKAKNIKKTSKLLLEKHNGVVPSTFEELEELPGVGHKTASVIMSQAFGKSAFPVDTHIHRLAKRWKLSSGKSVKTTENDLKRKFDESLWNKLHLQMIFYGREYCQARKKKCLCEICETVS